MSDNGNDTKNEDTANNNTTTEQKPVDDNQIKVNNMLKDRLRKYIKKLDGKFFFYNILTQNKKMSICVQTFIQQAM